MRIHQVQCDYCKAKADLKYNGEHYLIPTDWRELFDDHRVYATNEHACPKCLPPKRKKKDETKKGPTND
jgi:hypothetical protein